MVDSPVSEFDLIKRYFCALGPRKPELLVGPGDDCAVILPPPDSTLCCSIDTLVEGVHFPVGMESAHVATRALGSALSDLAAMGATASHFTLALTMPKADNIWLKGFADSLAKMADLHQVSLAGGDTTRGPLSVSIQVHGWLPLAGGLMRSGAQTGDLLAVSGTLGDAGGGLKLALGETVPSGSGSDDVLTKRFYCPEPRINLGLQLRGVATSCIDISDGLLSDATHLAQGSNVCLSLDPSLLPISDALRESMPSQALELALGAGDDYELLFTLSAENFARLSDASLTNITVIGRVTKSLVGGQVSVLDTEGLCLNTLKSGYVHFE